MVQTEFFIGHRDWLIVVSLDVSGTGDICEVYDMLMQADVPDYKVREACMELSRANSGYTHTDYGSHVTLTFASRGTSYDELYDTIQHELLHITEHIGTYYGLDPKGEEMAYLQGEIARKMFPAVAMVVCPACSRLQ